ncbi:histone-like nucleoid-structuring protein Lsr2 [Streptomyces sp. NPDC058664]|uniref:Lsr2 family DNA-binding protein n=1 Tax=unclassified Streptomyces TaxID=2593676 RepID=UPI0036487987
MTALTALTALCPPPAAVPPAPDWPRVEDTLGTGLPEDYKGLVAAYGPGQFCDFLSLYQPCSSHEWLDLTGPMPRRLRGQIAEVRQAARQPRPLPHTIEDLFAMGVTGNGDYLFWVTRPSAAPDDWIVTVNEALSGPWFTYGGSVTEFLVAVLGGTVRVPLFPADLLDRGITFTPSPLRGSAPATTSRMSVSTRTIRDWARANGYDLPDRGRVPLAIKEAWEQHSSG